MKVHHQFSLLGADLGLFTLLLTESELNVLHGFLLPLAGVGRLGTLYYAWRLQKSFRRQCGPSVPGSKLRRMGAELLAVVFDFDGLILDTETPEVLAWQRLFAHHGCVFPDWWWQDAVGKGADQIARSPYDLLAEQLGSPIDEAEMRSFRRRLLNELLESRDALPGVRDLLSSCSTVGIRVAIASSSRYDWVEGFLSRLGLLASFETIVCADDVPRAKPFPDLYREALDRLALTPERALALEDSPNGIHAAKAAGLKCFAVPNDVTRQLDLSAADEILPTLEGATAQDLRAMFEATQSQLRRV